MQNNRTKGYKFAQCKVCKMIRPIKYFYIFEVIVTKEIVILMICESCMSKNRIFKVGLIGDN